MIPRYTRPEMAAIWEPQTRFRIWFEIEAHATEKLGELGVVERHRGHAELVGHPHQQEHLVRPVPVGVDEDLAVPDDDLVGTPRPLDGDANGSARFDLGAEAAESGSGVFDRDGFRDQRRP